MDFKSAVEAMQRRQATLEAVGSGVTVKQDGNPNRERVVDEVKKFLAKKSLLKDPKTVKTYTERLGYFLDWCERSGTKHLDQLTHGDNLLPFVSFLRQRKTTRDTCLNPVTYTTSSKPATHSCVPMASFSLERSLGSWTSSPPRAFNLIQGAKYDTGDFLNPEAYFPSYPSDPDDDAIDND
jgi:hypothetical protein